MKTLVKRLMRPYHLELGCVEAYESNAPVTSQSDTTKTVTYDFSGTYHPQQDSVNVQTIRTETVTVGRDTISTQSDTTNKVITKEDVGEEKGWMGKRAWDGFVEWVFGEEDT